MTKRAGEIARGLVNNSLEWHLCKDIEYALDAYAAEEREACARVAESYEPRCDICPSGVAAAIRYRK